MLMDRGVLVRWNDEKGFGFIQPDQSGARDVFIHISVLKKMARKPKVGDSILYRTEVQNDGKIKAVLASIEGVAVLAASPNSRQGSHQESRPQYRSESVNYPRQTPQHRPRKSFVNTIIPLLLIIAIGSFGVKQYQAFNNPPTENDVPALTNGNIEPNVIYETKAPTQSPVTQAFKCETGKTHCSHMRSCAEATFYIQNCPNTQMDGDDDGIPCESQWCS